VKQHKADLAQPLQTVVEAAQPFNMLTPEGCTPRWLKLKTLTRSILARTSASWQAFARRSRGAQSLPSVLHTEAPLTP
jgi:hypothetical protein